MISGACIVTMPHTLSLIDASKGIEMFNELRVPILGIVENMAYFRGDDGKLYYPFGHGGLEIIKRNLSSPNERLADVPYHSFPISTTLSQLPTLTISPAEVDTNSNTGILKYPYSDESLEYDALADSMISSLFKYQLNAQLV